MNFCMPQWSRYYDPCSDPVIILVCITVQQPLAPALSVPGKLFDNKLGYPRLSLLQVHTHTSLHTFPMQNGLLQYCRSTQDKVIRFHWELSTVSQGL